MSLEHDYKNFPELTNSQMEQLQFSSPHEQITGDFEATAITVHDGDTVTLRTTFRDFDFPLRLLNIDADELSEGGDIARDWLKAKIENKLISIQIDENNRVGKYGRLLGTIFYNGMDVAEEMLQLGIVKAFGSKKEGEVKTLNQIMKEGEVE